MKMRYSSYLLQVSSGIFYFRKAVPAAIRKANPHLPASIRVSLRTRNPREAIALSHTFALKYDDYFSSRQAAMKNISKLDVTFTYDEAGRKIATFSDVKENDVTTIQNIVKSNVWSDSVQAAKDEEILNELLAPPPRQKQVRVNAPEETFSDVVRKYILYKDTERHPCKPETSSLNNAALMLFSELLGNPPISMLSHELVNMAINRLALVPPNRSKIDRFRNKTIEHILAYQEQHPDSPRLSDGTYFNHIAKLKAFFAWAKANGYPVEDYGSSRRSRGRSSAASQRQAYSNDEMKNILTALHAQRNALEEWKFYISLIAIYSGARQNEITQLNLIDIVDDVPIPYLIIREGEGQSLKNAVSERQVTIHSEVIAAGFLGYVAKRRQDGFQKAFLSRREEELSGKMRGQKVSKWWNRTFMTSINCQDKDKKCFHSIRHTVATTLQQTSSVDVQVAEGMIKRLLGHSTGSITFDRYAKGYSIEQIRSLVEKIQF